MWLDPDNEQLQLLQSALVSCFPDCNDLNCDPSRGIDAFTPHLSVGQWKDEGQVKQAIQVKPCDAVPCCGHCAARQHDSVLRNAWLHVQVLQQLCCDNFVSNSCQQLYPHSTSPAVTT